MHSIDLFLTELCPFCTPLHPAHTPRLDELLSLIIYVCVRECVDSRKTPLKKLREEAKIICFIPGMCLAQPMMTTSSRSAKSHSVVKALMSLSGMVGSGMA